MSVFSRAAYPNWITIFRLLITPFIVLCVYLHAFHWAMFLFGLGCLSDTLDGAVARSMGTTSHLGGVLDHTADKLLIISTLFTFSVLGLVKTWDHIPIYIMVFRDIALSGLREIAASYARVLPADWLGKSKTVVQMMAILAIFLHELGSFDYYWIGSALLWLGATLSSISFFNYCRKMSHV